MCSSDLIARYVRKKANRVTGAMMKRYDPKLKFNPSATIMFDGEPISRPIATVFAAMN